MYVAKSFIVPTEVLIQHDPLLAWFTIFRSHLV
jgi:hypothetical protein